MATSKIERLMNLVICLLSTRQFLTADKIRDIVAGYQDSASDEAFSRMFERDKNELRDLGVPLETGPATRSPGIEGYRIDRAAYELPEIELDREESAAVAIAAALWESPELAAAAQNAMLKLRAAGVQLDPDTDTPITSMPPRTRGSEPALESLLAAIDAGRSVQFSHRGAPNTPFTTRTVQPWGVVTRYGRWYLVGHDEDRNAVRTFRLSRIGDDVVAIGQAGSVHKPDDVDVRSLAERAMGEEPDVLAGHAHVWVAAGRAQELRRLASNAEPSELAGRSGDVVEIPVRSWEWIARVVAGHGADAVVLDPAAFRDRVIEVLRAAAGEGVRS